MSAPAKYARSFGHKRNNTDLSLGMGRRGETHYDVLSGNEPKRTFTSLAALEARLKAIDNELLEKLELCASSAAATNEPSAPSPTQSASGEA